MKKARVTKIKPLVPRSMIIEDQRAVATVKLVRFMDDYFGAGSWEHRAGEPIENRILRQLAKDAFMAGAGLD